MISKKIFFCFLFLFIALCSLAQNERNVWRMGFYPCDGHPYLMDFNSGHLVINPLTETNMMNMQITNGGICDRNGKLIFYTNGLYLADALHDTMENGSGFSPGPYINFQPTAFNISQGALVLPDPADSNQYYLFHPDINVNNLSARSLLISKIDMRFNGGLGKVVSKNVHVYDHDLIVGQMTAVKHANGRDWWLVQHHYGTDEYVLFLLSVNGLSLQKIQSIGINYTHPVCALFSPDGKKYAATYNDGKYVDIFNFNRCSGILSNYLHLRMPGNELAYGCSFSQKSQLFYVSTNYNVYQFNLKATDIEASRVKVGSWDSIQDPGGAFICQQLAPDGKIYLNGWGTTEYLSVINFPDNLGTACNVQQHAIFQGGHNDGPFPNYPFYELRAADESICDSLINNTNLTLTIKNDIEIFPNPSSEKLYLNLKENDKNVTIYITNLYGQLLFPRIINFTEYFEINIVDLSPGVYLLKYIVNEKQFVKKIVKE